LGRLVGTGTIGDMAKEIRNHIKEPAEETELLPKGDFSRVVSTGSTLLDLAISGTRISGGGVPSGILMEISGPSGFGKTTVLSEIGANAQARGGFFYIGDAEHRLNAEYAKMMGIHITDKNYRRPITVKDVEELILNMPVTSGEGIIDVVGIDSIAVLESELDTSDKGDKRGSSRAKELHSLCRKARHQMADKNRLIVFTNQIQDVQDGTMFGPKEKTPGGHAVPFMSSLRIRIGPAPTWKMKEKVIFNGKEVEQIIGIISNCNVFKSSIDRCFRTANIYIRYDYGIDDVYANLKFCKMYSQDTMYQIDGEIIGRSIDEARMIVDNNRDLEKKLKDRTIGIWESIQKGFSCPLRPKNRG